MDRFDSLSSTLSNLTMYDIKSMYNQAKNVVLNVSEMEAKVREATNEDPWGASSTLMGEISQGTFNFAHFNEIMPCIYGRFMEKEARQWRQIYKALVLLEYLIKNGSERVVDDARSHISTLKMLRNFHYIDDKGKDEGINVRNRSKELVELLSDVDKIRTERRKAKTNKNKYTGVGSDGNGFGGGGGRYGGFGSDGLSGGSGYVNDHYSGGGGGGGSSSSYNYNGGGSSSGYNDSSRRQYEEYDAGGDELTTPSTSRPSQSTRNPTRKASAPTATVPPPPPPAPVEDLLGDFGDDAFTSAPPAAAPQPPAASNKALPAVNPVSLDDDDFADFQAAPVSAAPVATPAFAPAPAAQAKPNLMDLLNNTATRPASVPAAQPFGQAQPFVQAQPPPGYGAPLGSFNMGHRPAPSLSSQSAFASPITPQVQPQPQTLFGGAARPAAAPQPSYNAGPVRPGSTPAAAKPASANFDDLWSLGLGSTSKPATPVGGTKSIQALQKEKAQASIWGGATSGGQQQKPQPAQFGSFGTAAPASSSSGGDDLLL